MPYNIQQDFIDPANQVIREHNQNNSTKMTIPTPKWNLTPVSQEELLRLKNDCEIPDMPTQLTYHLRLAPSGEGDRANEWDNKPHRLIYDACREIERLSAIIDEMK